MGRRHRKTRREKGKQRKLVILSMIGLLCVMSAGYAAFSTNLNITAKGNISKKYVTTDELKQQLCNTTSGDGLYKDTYESGRCIYKGSSPNNYITFNDELWRIVSIEDNGMIKVIRNEAIGLKIFDEKGSRTTGYCTNGSNFGCNAWMTISNFTNGNNSGNVSKDATINTYLNNEYYNSLNEMAKNKVSAANFKVGAAIYNETDLSKTINDEGLFTWNGKVGLLSISEFVRGSINEKCKSVNAYFSDSACYDNSSSHNYLFDIVTSAGLYNGWLITPYKSNPHDAFLVRGNGNTSSHGKGSAGEANVVPVLYLKSDLVFSGKGNETDPFKIKE